MMDQIAKKLGLALLFAVAVGSTASSVAQTDALPELGDSATQYLNPDQEAVIGREFYHRLVHSQSYADDYELEHYLQRIGERISRHADLRGVPLTLSLIKDRTINAFAVPGGYITFNTGLILHTETESELASVISHEIAHLTQRHLPRMLARANETKLPAIAAVVASILVGGQAGVAGAQAASAAIAGTQLRYSRDFEREADAVGLKLLAKTDFDPRGMADFFGKLERYTHYESADMPEFLLTHPLSYTRLAEAESRVQGLAPRTHQSSFDYHLAKARIRALYTTGQGDPLLFFEAQQASDDPLMANAGFYGEALVAFGERNYAHVQATLDKLSAEYRRHPWVSVLATRALFAQGEQADAIAAYDDLLQQHPDHRYIAYYQTDTLLAAGQTAAAKKAIRYQLRRTASDRHLYRRLARAHGDMGNLAEAHQARAEYFAVLGNYRKAIGSLELALQENGESGYLGESMKARLSELEELERIQTRIRKG